MRLFLLSYLNWCKSTPSIIWRSAITTSQHFSEWPNNQLAHCQWRSPRPPSYLKSKFQSNFYYMSKMKALYENTLSHKRLFAPPIVSQDDMFLMRLFSFFNSTKEKASAIVTIWLGINEYNLFQTDLKVEVPLEQPWQQL